MAFRVILKNLGLSDKEIDIYLKILELGPSSVRKIAANSKINRGTTYDVLKALINLGLVSYFFKNKNKYFIAEDPSKLRELVRTKQESLAKTEKEIIKIIPELKSIHDNAGDKPKVKFYEGEKGIKAVLQDLLSTVKKGKEYFAYSSADIRNYLYRGFPEFSKERIKKGIRVKVIAIGAGGELRGLDARKWVSKKLSGCPTYTLIYEGKIAMISVDRQKQPVGIIIEDEGIYKTQKMLFTELWKKVI